MREREPLTKETSVQWEAGKTNSATAPSRQCSQEESRERRGTGHPHTGGGRRGLLLHNNGVLTGRGCAQCSGDPGPKDRLVLLETPQGKNK